MTGDVNLRALRIVGEAVQLQGSERDTYVLEQCGDDAELLAEVRDLLRADAEVADTHIGVVHGHGPPRGHFVPGGLVDPDGPSSKSDRGSTSTRTVLATLFSRLLGTRQSRLRLAIAFLVAFALLTTYSRTRLRSTLDDSVGGELAASLSGRAEALQVWALGQILLAESFAGIPEMAEIATGLSAIADTASESVVALTAAPEQAAFRRLVDPVTSKDRAQYINVSIVSNAGRALADREVAIGTETQNIASIDFVITGGPRFFGPSIGAETARVLFDLHDPPVTRAGAPIRDASGRTLATVWVFEAAVDGFNRVLRGNEDGRGEVYGVDSNGFLISGSRYTPELVDAGVIEDAAVDETFGSTPFRTISLRDPGVDLRREVPDDDRSLLPFTESARLLLAASERTPDSPLPSRGLILEPYRNYVGDPVVGAWIWLHDIDLGLIAEVGAAEAYAPLRYFDWMWMTVLAACVLFGGMAISSTGAMLRLRHRVGRAEELGKYRLDRKIGEGGMGQVYVAEHALLKRPTAVKILRPELVGPRTVARFEREVRLASSLNHPNSVEIFDYDVTDQGTFYFAMELVAGFSLRELLTYEGALPPARAIHVLRQVCASLAEAHERGLIHRDIKPANVMLTRLGPEVDFVKVLDFGLAKDLTSDAELLTRTTEIGGTPLYMAPERIRSPVEVDERSDLYSLGAVGFELLAGRRVWQNVGELDLITAILHEDPLSLAAAAPGVPAALSCLIDRALAREPSNRPTSALQMLVALEGLQTEFRWGRAEAGTWWDAHASSVARTAALGHALT